MARTIRRYYWDANSIKDYKGTPFHVLATECQVFTDWSRRWHIETLEALAEADPILQTTGWNRFDGSKSQDCDAFTDWSLDHTAGGGEGMIIKPNAFLRKTERASSNPL